MIIHIHCIIHITMALNLVTSTLLTTLRFLLVLIVMSAFPQYSYSQKSQPPNPNPNQDYSMCNETSYNCGEIKNIFYPFWGQNRPSHCGRGGDDLFKLTCDSTHGTTTISFGKQNFEVVTIDITAHTIKMKRTGDVCSPDFEDTYVLSPNLFQYLPSVQDMSMFFECPSFGETKDSICGSNGRAFCYAGSQSRLMEVNPLLRNCGRYIQVPTEHQLKPGDYDVVSVGEMEKGLEEGFSVKYNVNEGCVRCLGKDGHCDDDDIQNSVKSSLCYQCPDGSPTSSHNHCSVQKHSIWNWKRKTVIAGAASILFLGIMIILFCKRSTKCINFGFLANNHDQVEAFLKDHGALSQKRYTFSEVKKMTNSFKTKLGEGGFGVVYKGNLHNSSPIAVKILKASKENGEEFINEVSSISRTSHVNVVSLVGFCFEGKKKALIYEFMPNGSLDKFIYNKGPQNTASLSWEMLYQIAKGIARGLEYLHKRCNSRILHFDIKPHNILLDENFCPKISDFGLAKVYSRRDSVISMSILRGTMGYIAPELWNRRYGGVSHKSDVYSYGMMLLEMVGVRTINSEADQTSEYFPDWIYKQLESCGDLRHDGVKDTKENERIRQMTIVGLWCIQTFPNDRPTSCKVVKMLEGNMNSLEIPPKPILSSHIRSVVVESSTS